jgi:hypothetical protein
LQVLLTAQRVDGYRDIAIRPIDKDQVPAELIELATDDPAVIMGDRPAPTVKLQ